MSDLPTTDSRFARRPALAAVLLGVVLATAAAADDAGAPALIADAERSMSDGDYAAGVRRYVDAALAGDGVETARQATLTAFEFGFDALAAQAAERWAALDPAPWRPQLYAAMATLRRGDVDDAVDRMRAVFDGDVASDAACDLLDERLTRGIRSDDAHAALGALAKRYKDTPCIIRLAASAALGARDYDDVERQLERLERLGAFDNRARLIEMARLVALDDIDAALTDERLRLDDAATVQQRIEAAFLHARADESETALNMLSLLATEFPDDADVLEAQAIAQLQAGNAAEARRGFLELLSSGEKTADALFYLGRFAESERRAEQALRLYSQVDSGALAVAAQQRAAALLSERDGIPEALSHIDQFVERHPRHGLDLAPVKGNLYAEGGYYDQALAAFDDYLAIKPRAEFAWLARADVLLRADRLDDAIGAFRDTVKAFPESPNALNALGYTLADRTKRLREAERLIDRALEKEPDNAAIIDSKGWVLFRRGKLDRAREYLERAWSELPDPEVAAHLGETLWRMGEEQAARDLLEEAWQRFPGDEVLRETIRRLLEDGPQTRS